MIHNGLDDYVLDVAGQATNRTVKFYDNAGLVTASTSHGNLPALHQDGVKDWIELGRVRSLEASDKVAFSIDFERENPDSGTERLVYNHLKLALSIRGDGLMVHAATTDQGFKPFFINNLGLMDTNMHRAIVMVDSAADHLQVILDDQVVLDVTNVDFQIAGAGGRESGWYLGSPWSEFFQGNITDFHIGDQFTFLDDTYVPPAQSAFG